MKRALTLFLFPLFASGVFGESVSVMEGDSVTLHTDAELQGDEEIVWRFNMTRIAKVIRNNATYDAVVRFRDRLQLDNQTGDLKIKKFRVPHSGLYKFEITSPRVSSDKTFSVSAVSGTGVKPVSVMVGDSVTLHINVPDIQRYDVILWRFGQQKSPLAEINRKAGIFNTSDGPDGRFRHRLLLDSQTGSLTIESIGTKHSGLYEVDISNSSSRYTTHKTFNLTVSDAVKPVLVKKGYSVTLQINVTEIQKDDQILWMFEDIVIAEIDEAAKLFYIYDGPDGRFRDRLKLDNQTGSLTITNTCTTGLYEQKISSRRHAIKRRFTVIVTAVSGSGLSAAAVTGIGVVDLLLVSAAGVLVALVIHYRRKISELERRSERRQPLLPRLRNTIRDWKTPRRER
ncbi:uncharacterized protein LOC109084643 isoform X1 [Cyprinus carpio]|uniref:Uncharacterized protein LOC109084643 isoform X1 n=1 Tax=Cyprinus carpio TaxID=7962 RepID=A0A8C1NA14_CYPCA|nr:uncharacterized protein LOC109084643 isoform X1 [Cyprinus carpio]